MKKKKSKNKTNTKEKFMYAVCNSGDSGSFSLHSTYKGAVENCKQAVGEGCTDLVIYKAVESVNVNIELIKIKSEVKCK